MPYKKLKALTYSELKEFISTLTDEQLSDPVRWWGDERGSIIQLIEPLEEDYFYNVDSEFWEPVSEMNDDLTQYPDKFLKKGTIIMHTDQYEEETTGEIIVQERFNE